MKAIRKRIISVLLSAALICTALPLTAAAADFTDVASNSWYYGYVQDLVGKGVINGTSPTTFSPEKPLTRAEFAAMLTKTVLTANELADYNYKGSFKDVAVSHWANCYINWASEAGIVGGFPDGTFKPNQEVTRQDMTVMLTRFASAVCRKMDAIVAPVTFSDSKLIADYAAKSVETCQRAGVITGYSSDNTFKPKGLATRAEAASLYSNFLKKCLTGNYIIIRKRILNTSVRAVEFNAADYTSDLIIGRDVADGGESAVSMAQRSGAKIAVNGSFFDMSSYQALGTLIKQGNIVTTCESYAPDKSAFTMNSTGNYSVQNFATKHTVTLHKEDGTDSVLNNVIVNRWPSSSTDAARILFNSHWGSTLCFKAKDAVTIAEDGTILAIDHDKDIEIPKTGYVLAQRSRRQYEGDFFDSCKVGDVLEIERLYEGAADDDIQLSIGAGPQLVKNGAVYGDISTYRAEGFTDPNITTYDAVRICVGIKPDGKLIILTAYTNLAQLSKIMVSLGCTEAINMDGGGSANIYVDGNWLRGPQDRKINNMLIFK